jgi:hypothetical protein
MTGQADCPHSNFFEAEDYYVCRVCGKRLAPAGSTRITDKNGTRWVKYTPRPRRKPARAVRFAEVAVGDELVCVRGASEVRLDQMTRYVVTDLWFDPVAGERDETAGMMVAIKQMRNGQSVGSKWPHTRRGLAMQGFHYAAEYLNRREQTEQTVVGALDAIRSRTFAELQAAEEGGKDRRGRA